MSNHVAEFHAEVIRAVNIPSGLDAPHRHAVQNLFHQMYRAGNVSFSLVAYNKDFRNVAKKYLAQWAKETPGASKSAQPLFDFLNKQFSLAAIQEGRAFISI
jgi:predicted Zn-dependent peptidase